MNQHVMVGMSGGVDSSVAAYLLKSSGYRVSGLFMKNWDEDDGGEYCTAVQDHADASMVCERLGIPLHTVSFSAEYWDEVFETFLSEYRAGRTPNPDILCNRHIKFRAFLDHATRLGADLIATGHYASTQRLVEDAEAVGLGRARDDSKDQSYFLYAMQQDALRKTLFPLGGLLKRDVRTIASAMGLVTAAKKDSTGICFVGERPFREFLSQYIAVTPGAIETPEGMTVGEHQGLAFYTLGQRSGLGIGGQKQGGGEPWYVLAKDAARNVLIAGQGHDHPWLFSDALVAEALTWASGQPPESGHYTCKVRYRQPDQACELKLQDDGSAKVSFFVPQRAVTPGQSVVFYHENLCLGGGIIVSTSRHSRQASHLI
ncbi:MAG: tRNA (5-methylaminomethyl-2-thiouridylate)-methyltransferase [Pseudomonadota bacterium]